MKISVVTAVFNRRETLAEALTSTLDQSYRDLELLVQDGGSTDGSVALVEAMDDPRIRLVSAPDGGIYDALNRAIARASGEVIGLMHSDDRFASEHVLAQVAQRFEDPAVDGVYGDLEYVLASDPDRVVRHWRAGPFDPRRIRHGWMPPHPTLYLRRAVFDRFGVYDTSFRIAADYDAMLRYILGGVRLSYLPEVMVQMRLGGASNGSLPQIMRKSGEDFRAIRRNGIGGAGVLVAKNLSKLGQFRTFRPFPH